MPYTQAKYTSENVYVNLSDNWKPLTVENFSTDAQIVYETKEYKYSCGATSLIRTGIFKEIPADKVEEILRESEDVEKEIACFNFKILIEDGTLHRT